MRFAFEVLASLRLTLPIVYEFQIPIRFAQGIIQLTLQTSLRSFSVCFINKTKN